MLRYASPSLFFLAAFFVYWHNHHDGSSVWMLPYMEVIWPETAGEPRKQGDKTVIVLGVLGVVLMVLQSIKDWRYRKQLKGNFREPRT